jgi:hypothetical protein
LSAPFRVPPDLDPESRHLGTDPTEPGNATGSEDRLADDDRWSDRGSTRHRAIDIEEETG